MKIGVWICCGLMALSLAAPARAGAIQDGEAGLNALNNGSYDQAIQLFTRALKPGALSSSDREFAYYNRGKAYAAKEDYPHAISDLKQALKLKPDDADAQSALQDVQDKQSGSGESASARSSRGSAAPPTSGWGLATTLVDRYFWYEAPSQPTHTAYLAVRWYKPQTNLSLVVNSKSGQILVAEYQLDASTGVIISAAVSGGISEYGTASGSPSEFINYGFMNDTPNKSVVRLDQSGSGTMVYQNYLNGSWHEIGRAQLIETTHDELVAQGLIKAKKQ